MKKKSHNLSILLLKEAVKGNAAFAANHIREAI